LKAMTISRFVNRSRINGEAAVAQWPVVPLLVRGTVRVGGGGAIMLIRQFQIIT
jgi:hypothetical protein